jgi:hypothetical protein
VWPPKACAAEELVAELGAAFQMARLGLSSTTRPDHAAYIADWVKLLRDDGRAVFTAAKKAGQAVDWLATDYERNQANGGPAANVVGSREFVSERVEAAEAALSGYSDAHGSKWQLSDLLADVRHWAAAHGVNLEEALRSAGEQYAGDVRDLARVGNAAAYAGSGTRAVPVTVGFCGR